MRSRMNRDVATIPEPRRFNRSSPAVTASCKWPRLPRQSDAANGTTVDLIGRAIAKADFADFQADTERCRRLGLAALGPLAKPTDAMVDAASFDAHRAIDSRRDFRRAAQVLAGNAQAGQVPVGAWQS